jgi:hypothetical protein
MAQRQIPNLPPVIYLSPTAQIEIVQDGSTYRTSAGQIGALGGFHVENDITSTPSYFPIFLRQSTGTLEAVYASDPYYEYIPVEGRLSALRPEAFQGIVYNTSAVTLDYTFPTGDNATSCGPLTLTAAITVPTGSEWMIL